MRTLNFRLNRRNALALFLTALFVPVHIPAAELGTYARTNFALVLDGKTGFMQVSDAPAFHSLSNAVTFELWFNARSFAPQNFRVNCLLRKNVTAGRENFFLRFRTMDQVPVVEFCPGPAVGTMRVPFKFQIGKWYHLAATYDGATAVVLVNGTSVASQPLSGSIRIDAAEMLVGRGDPDYSGGEYFDGMMDELRIWNIARSAKDIQAAATTPLSRNLPGLVAYWNFDTQVARGESGQGIESTLQGKTAFVEVPLPARLETPTPEERTAAARALTAPGERPVSTRELSVERRLEILDDLWQKLSEIYPALEYKGIRGREWIEPTVERARTGTAEQFYPLLLEFMASLKDTHTRIASYPGEPRLAAPPVRLYRVEGKVAVLQAEESTGLKPGDLVVSVDGTPVEECLARQLKYTCASTDRARDREACSRLLTGEPGTKVALEIQGANEVTRTVTLRRGGRAGFMNEPTISSRRLGNGLGYIRIARWGGENLVPQFDQALEEFKDCKGLVIDVRGNGGGSDQLADLVNGRFIDEAVVSSIDFWRKQGTDEFRKTVGWVQPRGPWTFRNRLAVLIDEGCASACEHFVSGIEAMGRILLVGTPTNGAGGGPTVVRLCDGTRVVISRALGVRANGVVFEGHGIPPHVFSAPTLEDLRRGRDGALETAETWLLSGEPVPARSQALPAPAL